MTQLQDVRKFIQKGDRAVQLLESLGYTYMSGNKSEPRWIAPVAMDPKEVLAKFLREQADMLNPPPSEANSFAGMELPPIPVGRRFTINHSRIPSWHTLSTYPHDHFRGVIFEVLNVFKPETNDYPTGWAVSFCMRTAPFARESVWVPLSACAFR